MGETNESSEVKNKSCSNDNCRCSNNSEQLLKDAHETTNKLLSRSIENLQEASLATPNILWPTIGEFNIEIGKKKIDEYIQTWEISCNWLYCIDFLCKDDLPYYERYRYKVQWSVPTRRRPIPRATANVYFSIDVSTVKPKDYPCEVTYTFETNKLLHVPGKSRFREKWLKDIIESKNILMDTVEF